MDGRLPKACINLRVVPADLLDALCSLSGRPSPPSGPHPVGDRTRLAYSEIHDDAGCSVQDDSAVTTRPHPDGGTARKTVATPVTEGKPGSSAVTPRTASMLPGR